MDVVVVGAGVLGASVAYHAARAGAAVTLVDAGRPGGGVTAGSFAWIGSAGVRTGPAAELRRSATAEYRRLQGELPGLPVTWSGSLSWDTTRDAPEPGPGQELLDGAAVARLEPALRRPPEWALWAPGDGSVDPVGVTERLVAGARAHGASVRPDLPAVRLDPAGVGTAAGFLPADTVVLAAGVATAALAAPLGVRVPVGPSPATLVRLSAPAGLVRTVVSTEDFDLRQAGPDQLVAAADSADRTLAAVRSAFRGADGVELLGARVSDRPMPADGEPIVGPAAPGLYVAVLHAAVTLAPAVGRLVASELVHGAAEPLLAGCRPGKRGAGQR